MPTYVIRNLVTGEEIKGDWSKAAAIKRADELAKESGQAHDVLVTTVVHHSTGSSFSFVF